jgi:hypothetical protein
MKVWEMAHGLGNPVHKLWVLLRELGGPNHKVWLYHTDYGVLWAGKIRHHGRSRHLAVLFGLWGVGG